MIQTPPQQDLHILASMPPYDPRALLDRARALQQAARAGTTRLQLLGKNVALLSESDDEDGALFCSAAVELGARVARIRPSFSELGRSQDVQHTAHVLGRLYDAVECQGVATALVLQMHRDAGVPVYDGLATPHHPTARLVELVGGDATAADKRRFVVQAVMLTTLA